MAESLDDNYKRAYANRIGFGKKPALILVDFVEAYYDKACDLYAGAGARSALDVALRVRAAAHRANIPVVLTNVVYHPTAINGGRFMQKALVLKNFLEGSPMGAWPQGLVPTKDELIVSKQYPSAFFGTSLASTLTTLGIDTLMIAGLTTSGCVRATCVDACSHGFIPIVVEEACGDRHEAPHKANLFDMNAKYADVVGEAEAVAYLDKLGARVKALAG
jgi:maleamate amidohydrolase